jgi:hypothetical protein
VRVHNASAERKTAENLLKLLEEVLKNVQDEWGVIAVAVVTDASGESRKARRMLAKKYPALVVIDCYLHQVSRCSINSTFTLSYLDAGQLPCRLILLLETTSKRTKRLLNILTRLPSSLHGSAARLTYLHFFVMHRFRQRDTPKLFSEPCLHAGQHTIWHTDNCLKSSPCFPASFMPTKLAIEIRSNSLLVMQKQKQSLAL